MPSQVLEIFIRGLQVLYYFIFFNCCHLADDWTFQRGSYTYFLGDSIHFEVSAVIGNHMPLRVYIDHCVGTATPDADVALRYDFVEHG